MKPLSEDTRKRVIEDITEGYSYAEIAERNNVSFSTIRRLKSELNEQKKSPEAPTAMENASEDITVDFDFIDTNIVPEVPENVKQDDYSPYESAVDEAVLERMEKLRDRITDLQLEMSNYESEISRLEEYHLKYLEVQNDERNNENR